MTNTGSTPNPCSLWKKRTKRTLVMGQAALNQETSNRRPSPLRRHQMCPRTTRSRNTNFFYSTIFCDLCTEKARLAILREPVSYSSWMWPCHLVTRSIDSPKTSPYRQNPLLEQQQRTQFLMLRSLWLTTYWMEIFLTFLVLVSEPSTHSSPLNSKSTRHLSPTKSEAQAWYLEANLWTRRRLKHWRLVGRRIVRPEWRIHGLQTSRPAWITF